MVGAGGVGVMVGVGGVGVGVEVTSASTEFVVPLKATKLKKQIANIAVKIKGLVLNM